MPQKGIFIGEHINNFALFYEFKISDDSNIDSIKQRLLDLIQPSNEDLNVVLCFGKNALKKFGATIPENLQEFQTIKGINELIMPTTQADIFIWAHSTSKSKMFDFSEIINNTILPVLTLTVREEGFKYKDSRDLLGFVDGSANPKGVDKRKLEALIPMGEKNENGSYVLVQKWIHKINKFKANPLKEQEGIIGRTRKESIELEGEDMPKDSHVSRTDTSVNGEAAKIFRRSYPYANADHRGLYFLAFSKRIERFDIQLRRMVGDTEDKISDKLMDFSTPTTGSYYYAPSERELLEFLN